MICRPDRRLLALLLAVLAFGGPLAAAPADDAIAEAIAAIERGDGVAAELAGKRALEQGASRDRVAAYIGEGELLQGDLRDARQWLGEAEFDRQSRNSGLYALARLEIADDDLPAAAQAFDLLLQSSPGTALVWVDIGRMRYSAGEHHAALQAARRAVQLGPQEPRALEFHVLLARDAQGLNAALPLFCEALEIAPDDMGLLGQYAATLGDAGQNQEMLRVARRMVELDGNAGRAYYLQAILAARTGHDDLARRLLWRTTVEFAATPSGRLLTGVLEYRAGNYALAVEEFDTLLRAQPFNETALLLFGRALLANGEANEVVAMLEPHAQRPDASNYLLTLVGRAHEQLGQRQNAASYLDRAAHLAMPSIRPIPAFLPRDDSGRMRDTGNTVVQLRRMLSEGQYAEARAKTAELGAQFSGSIDLEVLSGDVELLAGSPEAALAFYRRAAVVRRNWPLVRRIVAAHSQTGDERAARQELARHLSQNPRDAAAAALLGRMQRNAGNPARATALLRHAASLGSGLRDPLLLADLAELELAIDNGDLAAAHAGTAHDLQRGNRRVARSLARVYEMGGAAPAVVEVLLAKARGIGTAGPANK